MRAWTTVAAAAALAITLSACGSDDGGDAAADPTTSATASDTPTSSPSEADPSESASVSEPPVEPSEEPVEGIVITIAGDEITPNGKRIEVERNETVTLEITSDRAGELHVHSTPEQYVEFEAGTSTHELVIEAPGVVDVEEHETGHVVVQLEVS